MSDKNTKKIRNEIRQAVAELLPAILSQELSAAIQTKLADQLGKRMDVIAGNAKQALENIDTRQKDFQNYMVKEMAKAVPTAVPSEGLTPTSTTSQD